MVDDVTISRFGDLIVIDDLGNLSSKQCTYLMQWYEQQMAIGNVHIFMSPIHAESELLNCPEEIKPRPEKPFYQQEQWRRKNRWRR